MDDLEGVVKELVKGYVVSHKKPETIDEYFEKCGIKDLFDVRQIRGLATLLGVKFNASEIRRELFRKGYLTDVPISKIVGRLNGGTWPNPYLNPDVVGEDKAEEHRELILQSQEFSDYIVNTYNYLCDIKHRNSCSLAYFFGLKDQYSMNEIRRRLFKNGNLTEVPIAKIVKALSTQGALSPYLRSDVVGEEKVEEHREIVLCSPKFAQYVTSNYNSLMDVSKSKKLAYLFGVNKNKTEIRRELFQRGFLTEVPVAKIIEGIKSSGHSNPYFNSKIVGDEKVKEYRKIVSRSPEFANYVQKNYSSLKDIGKVQSLASLLGVSKGATAIRQALVDRGLFIEEVGGVVQDLMESYTNG